MRVHLKILLVVVMFASGCVKGGSYLGEHGSESNHAIQSVMGQYKYTSPVPFRDGVRLGDVYKTQGLHDLYVHSSEYLGEDKASWLHKKGMHEFYPFKQNVDWSFDTEVALKFFPNIKVSHNWKRDGVCRIEFADVWEHQLSDLDGERIVLPAIGKVLGTNNGIKYFVIAALLISNRTIFHYEVKQEQEGGGAVGAATALNGAQAQQESSSVASLEINESHCIGYRFKVARSKWEEAPKGDEFIWVLEDVQQDADAKANDVSQVSN